ncbi:MAG: hypothetical protein NTZ56_03765 [Acidobacteria bacterium]|nr:hypothetical protein [Acidobacteriota bacterium]
MRVLCGLGLLIAAGGAAFAQPTYSREISRIFQAKCIQCHRPGDIAPFALTSFELASTWAPDIKRVLNDGLMPHWKPVEGHGKFLDSFALTADEKQQILDWVEAGAPQGDEADLPPAVENKAAWPLGDPDKILEMPASFTPPRGRDLYRCFVLDPKLEDDKFIAAVDYLPGNRKSVHHIILYLDESGEAEKKDGADGSPGYNCYGGPGVSLVGGSGAQNSLNSLLGFNYALGGWAPGSRTRLLPENIGLKLSRRAKIIMQIHYYTAVSTDPDQTRIGLYYSKKPVEKSLYFLPMVQTRLTIPAGDPNYQANFDFTVPILLDAQAINVFPHMHLLGRDIRAWVELPSGGDPQPLIWINNWDFNWQGAYTYEKPVELPAFSRIKMTCKYDNSDQNPRNPSSPPKVVRWGEGTEDEMCVAFLGVTFKNENLLNLILR